jgi:hypothetical protein
MADLITIVALDNWAINLIRLLGAFSLHVAKLLAVGTLDDATINRLTSILQSLKVLLRSWPSILLLWTGSLIGPTPRNRVLLVKITLKVH